MRLSQNLEAALLVVVPLASATLLGVAARVAGPSLAPGALALGLVATTLVVASVHRDPSGHAMDPREQQRDRQRRHRQLAMAIGAVLLTIGIAWLAEPSAPLLRMTRQQLHAAFREDARQLHTTARSMESVLGRMEAAKVPAIGDELALSARDEKVLADSWRALIDHAVALENLRLFYHEYYLLDLDAKHHEHAMAFLLTFAADLALYEKAHRFTVRVRTNSNATKFLDAPGGLGGRLRAGSFSHFREDILGVGAQLRITAGEEYLKIVEPVVMHGPLAGQARPIIERIKSRLAKVDGISKSERVDNTYRAELQRLKRGAQRAWYPLQKEVAEMLGDTRVRRVHQYLIGQQLREHVNGMMQPGDIIISRKNWYLSNIGLPGFWPHAILYLGTPDKLSRYFDDPAVLAWLADEHGSPLPFADWLAAQYPKAWEAYGGRDHDEPKRVIEAVSEGVVFSSLAACAGDYMAALRPKLSKLDKAKAIADAFSNWGKPYDFDFDFATDHALVCTELVYRAYRSAASKTGVDMPLVEMAGRLTLPANELVAQYARRAGTPGAQLEFVAFIDARERIRQAFLSNEEAFRHSHRRLKWDIAQE
jgi:hypothetical protein